MREADQTPFATDGRPTTQQEAAESTCFFDLPKHRFHDHLASGIQCLAGRRPYCHGHALLGTGSVLWERFCLLQSSLRPCESGKFPAQIAAFLVGLKRLRELLGW